MKGKLFKYIRPLELIPNILLKKNLLDATEESTLKPIKEKITAIHFYEAGCSST